MVSGTLNPAAVSLARWEPRKVITTECYPLQIAKTLAPRFCKVVPSVKVRTEGHGRSPKTPEFLQSGSVHTNQGGERGMALRHRLQKLEDVRKSLRGCWSAPRRLQVSV